MFNNIHYSRCPVCGSTELVKVFSAKDHTVSAESFDIVECGSCTLRITQDAPSAASIGPYYKSEDYISHSNTSKGLVNRLYQVARKRTVIAKCRMVQRYTGLATGKLLDLGSGTGTFVHAMLREGWDAAGIEPDEGARAMAKEAYHLDLEEMDSFYRLPPGGFNAITLWHVLEHIHDLLPCMGQLKKLLDEQGKLFIAVPNYTSLDAHIYQEHWAAYDVPRHLYHFSPASMKVLLKENGLKLLQIRPMWLDSFYIALLSSRYRKGTMKPVSAAWNGLRSNMHALANRERCSSLVYVAGKLDQKED